MKRFCEASAILSFSIIVTAMTVAAVMPVHPRGTAEAAGTPVGIVHAVANTGAEEPVADAGCLYLAAIAASSACTALPESAETTGCPFFDKQRVDESPKRARKPAGQHT